MSTQTTLAFTPDPAGQAIQFQKSADTTPVYAQVVIAKQGGDLNKASQATISASASSSANAEAIVAEDTKRVSVVVKNTHGSEALFVVGAASEAGGIEIANGAERTFYGGGALYGYRSSPTGDMTLDLFENLIGS